MADFVLPEFDELQRGSSGRVKAWGLFGDDDNVGQLNRLGRKEVRAAGELIRQGKVFALDLPIGSLSPSLFPQRPPVRHHVFSNRPGLSFDDSLDGFFLQEGSQWDSLGHVAFEPGLFYNGASAEEVEAGERNTIDHWARRGIVGRGVLLDVVPDMGPDYHPGTRTPVTVSQLESALNRAGTDLVPGDTLVVHTGFLRWYLDQSVEARRDYVSVQPITAVGLEPSEDIARWLWETGCVAIASDCPAIEVWPATREGTYGLLHHTLIGGLGLALGELWSIASLADDCAADGIYEFFLASAPLHVRGGIGSPANALALK